MGALAAQYGLSQAQVMTVFGDTRRNTSVADYVWLPLRFEGEMVYIDWRDEWSLDEFEDASPQL